MVNLCKYKDIFGKPNEGIHSYRIMDIAVFDLIGTIIISYMLSYFTNIKFIKILLLLFLIGILCHHIFCVKTTIDTLLF
jgi:hypothetical protein